MLDDLIAILGTKLELTAEDIADVFWLTHFQQQLSIEAEPISPTPIPDPVRSDGGSAVISEGGDQQLSGADPQEISSGIATPSPKPSQIGVKPRSSRSSRPAEAEPKSQEGNQDIDRSIKVPNAPSIRDPLALLRALRPLIRRVPSGVATVLDEAATATQIAEAQIWLPKTKPVLEPWLELELVVDESTSMLIWRRTVLELQNLFKHYGAFRDIHIWGLVVDPSQNAKIYLRSGIGTGAKKRSLRSPQELIDPTGRRLILVVTDCLSSIWWDKTVLPTLASWADRGPVALLHMLPERLWSRTALRQAAEVALYGMEPGAANRKLIAIESSVWDDWDAENRKPEKLLKLPVFSLEPELSAIWSQMLAGRGGVASAGFLFKAEPETLSPARPLSESPPAEMETPPVELPSPEQRIAMFRSVSSTMARQLASLLAASPVISLPVIRLIQETLLPRSNQVHVAEVLLGGLFVLTATPHVETHPDDLEYRFVDERIRALLLPYASVSDTVSVLSRYLAQKFGKSLDWFIANWQVLSQAEQEGSEGIRAFAVVAAEVLKQKGKQYFEFIQAVEARYGTGDGTKQSATPRFLSLFPEDRGETLRAKIVEHYAPKQLMDQTKARALAFEIDAANRIICAYTGYSVQRDFSLPPKEDAFHKGVAGETLFPKSKSSQEIGADIHNILLARILVNSARGNKPFAEVSSDQVRVWYWDDRESSSAPTGSEDCAKLGDRVFEPRDAAKGCVARSMFYVYTMYIDRVNKRYFEHQQETLRKWHQQYPPTATEIERSRRIANSAQGNPNPFVLDPTLVDRMYPPEVSAQSGQEPVWEAFEFDVAVVVELQTMEVDVASIVFEEPPADGLQPFNFVVAKVDRESQDDWLFRIRNESDLEAKIDLIDACVLAETEQYLSDLQKAILRGAWQKKTYEVIAEDISYSEGHLKNTGLELFQLLSHAIGMKVTKTAFRALFGSTTVQLKIDRYERQGWQLAENLGNGVTLELVAIPAGQFLMGSLEGEEGRHPDEGPQHSVTVSEFLLGKYPVTQAQWRVVAAMEQVNRSLKLQPSRFEGDDLPVERVSWWDAVEFCDRLSRETGKPYRLPSEAEWEYACRAGTMTPFHFGETITTDLVNYNGNCTYGSAPKGLYRVRTTPVGSFGVANDFGLYDMHGNVWEWCADHWHDNYGGAPTDGNAWLSENENASRLLRGGSWGINPKDCRSAIRSGNNPVIRTDYYGFRLACTLARTL